MDLWPSLFLGFKQVLDPMNILYCLGGVTIGTLIGVLPGIGPVATISMLLSMTTKCSPLASIIMLAGVYYGAMYGGSTTSILVNIPGEAASVVTCLDGYQMARRGRAGPALGISAFGSFIGGTLSIVGLMLLTIPLSKLAIRIGPTEYFALIAMGMTTVTYLTGDFLKGAIMAVIGLILGCTGTDVVTGKVRFAYGFLQFYEGIDIVPMVIGLFGISEVLVEIEGLGERSILKTRAKNLFPNLAEWRRSIFPIGRGSLIGFFLGLIPGGGSILSSFISYGVEKRISKHPEEFGKGAIEGVASPETANNAAVGGAFIPLFSLGIPSNAVTAILLASFMLHGVAPGPNFIIKNQGLFWGIICSMYLGNIMLLVLNLPLISIWVKILQIPYKILFPLILLFCIVGTYSVNTRTFDGMVMVAFGILGYLFRTFGYSPAPLVLSFVLGPMLELSFRQTMVVSGHDFRFIFTKPIALAALSITVFLLISTFLGHFKALRKRIIDSQSLED